MKPIVFLLLLASLSLHSRAAIVFSRAPTAGLIVSSWVDPNGSDADTYAYDEFALSSTQPVTEVRWRGGYTQNMFGGPVFDFTVTFFASIAGGGGDGTFFQFITGREPGDGVRHSWKQLLPPGLSVSLGRPVQGRGPGWISI